MAVRDRRPHVTPFLAAAVSTALLCAGCAGSPTGADAPHDTLQAAADGDTSGAGESVAGSPSRDPLAPVPYRPVARDGKPARPSVVAPAGRFATDTPVAYPDGIVVRVDRVTRSVEREEGIGSFPGRPQTAFRITLENGSTRPVDLSQTVVTTTYGVRPRSASPVYSHPEAQDFLGVVRPGGTATATYVFAIPPGQARTVRTMVDFDGVHTAATLTGLDEA